MSKQSPKWWFSTYTEAMNKFWIDQGRELTAKNREAIKKFIEIHGEASKQFIDANRESIEQFFKKNSGTINSLVEKYGNSIADNIETLGNEMSDLSASNVSRMVEFAKNNGNAIMGALNSGGTAMLHGMNTIGHTAVNYMGSFLGGLKDAAIKGGTTAVEYIKSIRKEDIQDANKTMKQQFGNVSAGIRRAVSKKTASHERNKMKHELNQYPLQELRLLHKSKHPKFINTKTMRDSYIKGPRGGHYYVDSEGQVFRVST
jgi:gas vesicle protein